ncbi:hypothetical protein OKA04_04520 [Luteolibacter flavescens]|uniref:Uncharacterized protein n=1 Tax=Luteolibacter flavescens TaxID=1859460 RepID=A0ABT3FK98_9BACT|nr:hypothetical protein [Luteolibacter flavescens]MCW1883980.1 hypothetical protein [Luteolibacter flavescens]
MSPDDHKTAPRCPLHRSPMRATGEVREDRHVFHCPVIIGRHQCSCEIERPPRAEPAIAAASGDVTDTEL